MKSYTQFLAESSGKNFFKHFKTLCGQIEDRSSTRRPGDYEEIGKIIDELCNGKTIKNILSFADFGDGWDEGDDPKKIVREGYNKECKILKLAYSKKDFSKMYVTAGDLKDWIYGFKPN